MPGDAQAVIHLNKHTPAQELVRARQPPPSRNPRFPTFRESERDLISATAVCKYWRKTLISTPTLWNKIICSEWEKTGITASYVQVYFERSGSIPVDALRYTPVIPNPFLPPLDGFRRYGLSWITHWTLTTLRNTFRNRHLSSRR